MNMDFALVRGLRATTFPRVISHILREASKDIERCGLESKAHAWVETTVFSGRGSPFRQAFQEQRAPIRRSPRGFNFAIQADELVLA